MTTIRLSTYAAFRRDPQMPKAEVLLLPTAAGLYRPLNRGYEQMASALVQHGLAATAVEFGGQNGRAGAYSVATSVDALVAFLEDRRTSKDRGVILFGVCSGALAALGACLRTPAVSAVACWELSAHYAYDTTTFQDLERRFGLVVDWKQALTPVQATDYIPQARVPLLLGIAQESRCTDADEQAQLQRLAANAETFALERCSHLPGVPLGSAERIARRLAAWCHTLGGDV